MALQYYNAIALFSTLRVLVIALKDQLYNYNPATEVAAKFLSRCKNLRCVQVQDEMDTLLYTLKFGTVQLRVLMAGEKQEYSWEHRWQIST